MTTRVAIYFTPPANSPLSKFATGWFGRDIADDVDLPRCGIPGIDLARQEVITRSPRRYGFHATLKAPFVLANGYTVDDIHHALANFVAGRPSINGLSLKVHDLFGFIALTPVERSPEVDDLAGACVETFEKFRAPLSEHDMARRRQACLTAHQDELLQRWGYPFVFDEYRFHMTLTEHLTADERHEVLMALSSAMAPYCDEPVTIDAVSLLVQQDRTSPFVLADRFPLGG